MRQWLLPISLILIGILTGLFCEKYLDKYIRSLKSESENEDIVEENNSNQENSDSSENKYNPNQNLTAKEVFFNSLNNITFIWLVLAGCFGAFLCSSLEPSISKSLQTVITVAFLFSITIFIARLSSGCVTLVGQRAHIVSASIISNLTRIIVFIFGFLITLQTIGVKITPILTTLGVGGLAIALAVQDTLSNIFSGLYLIISQQFKTGDYVKLETGQEGYVIDINWRTTTIKNISNNVILIPNSKLSSVIFTNYHLPVKEVVLQIDLGVSYNSNLQYVEQVTIEVAKQIVKEIAPELVSNEPFLRYHTFSDSSIDFTVFMRVNEFSDRRLGKHLFIKKLHQRYQQEKIDIPSPSREIFVKKYPDEGLRIYT